MDYKKIYKKVQMSYIIVGTIIAIIFISRQIVIQRQINLGKDMSQAINISGRQRMLSQKIPKDAYGIYKNEDFYQISELLLDLELSIDKFEKSHDLLLNNNKEGKVAIKNNDLILEMFGDIEPYYNSIVRSGKNILNQVKQNGNADNLIIEDLITMNVNEKLFLEKMEKIVSEYENQSDESLMQIERTEQIIFYLSFFAFIFAIFAIIIPTGKILKNSFLDIDERNNNINTLFDTVKSVLFLVKDDGEILFKNLAADKIINKNRMENPKTYINDAARWININMNMVIKDIKSGKKVDNIEVEVEDNDENILTFLVSASSGRYNRQDTILINAYEITLQKKVEHELKSASIKDELTGLYNRHFFDLLIDEEIGRSVRYNYPLSLIMLDIDNFKKINDTWGHPVGDIVLKELAEILEKNTRDSDYCIRIGGEEFIILMPHTYLEGAYSTAEKIRKIIEAHVNDSVGSFTASFGVAERKVNENYLELYSRIDLALYKAKHNGKNQTVKSFQKESNKNMYNIDWKESWESGEKDIDIQHREMFTMLQEIVAEKDSLKSEKDLEDKLKELLNHIKGHFEYEEKVLREIEYPRYLQHKKIHGSLVEKTHKLQEKAKNGEISYEEVIEFMLHDLILGHILKEDTRFFTYIDQE